MGSMAQSRASNAISKIIFVGAGVNAFATAIALSQSRSKYDIHIFEKRAYDAASSVAVAGLHLKPNSVRLLNTWGVSGFFERGRIIYSTKICRYADGDALAIHQRPISSEQNNSRQRSAETWYINRADLWVILYEKAVALGAKGHFGKNVKSIDIDRSHLHMEDGQTVDYDLLIGSDGAA